MSFCVPRLLTLLMPELIVSCERFLHRRTTQRRRCEERQEENLNVIQIKYKNLHILRTAHPISQLLCGGRNEPSPGSTMKSHFEQQQKWNKKKKGRRKKTADGNVSRDGKVGNIFPNRLLSLPFFPLTSWRAGWPDCLEFSLKGLLIFKINSKRKIWEICNKCLNQIIYFPLKSLRNHFTDSTWSPHTHRLSQSQKAF